MIADAKLDETYCCAHTTPTMPPMKMIRPKAACFFISDKGGKGSRLKKQKAVSATPAINNRRAENKNGGKDLSPR